MGRCLGAVGLFLTITRATFFFFTTILVASFLCEAAAERQPTENTGGRANACTAPPAQVVGAIGRHGDARALLGSLSLVLWCPVSPAGLSWSGPRPDPPPDQRLTAHPGAPRQCQGEVSRTISTCKSIPGGPGGLAPALPPLPPLQQHPFRGSMGHHAPPHLSGVI